MKRMNYENYENYEEGAIRKNERAIERSKWNRIQAMTKDMASHGIEQVNIFALKSQFDIEITAKSAHFEPEATCEELNACWILGYCQPEEEELEDILKVIQDVCSDYGISIIQMLSVGAGV